MGSPIRSWDGVEAYFTFADRPAVLAIILVVAVGFTVGVVLSAIRHENRSYAKLELE